MTRLWNARASLEFRKSEGALSARKGFVLERVVSCAAVTKQVTKSERKNEVGFRFSSESFTTIIGHTLGAEPKTT